MEPAGSTPGTPYAVLHTAAAAAATWQRSSPELPLRSSSPVSLHSRTRNRSQQQQRSTLLSASSRAFSAASRSRSCSPHLQQQHATSPAHRGFSPDQSNPVAGSASAVQQEPEVEQEDAGKFHSGVQHAGWLWKRFGRGHKTTWKKLWFYLCDDRLCYCQHDTAYTGSPGSTLARARSMKHVVPSAADSKGSPGPLSVGDYSGLGAFAGSSSLGTGGFAGTASSLAALAAGEVRYIALDRIPVRPLPHKQHALDPMEGSHPDVGIAIIDNRVLSEQPPHIPKHAIFSIVAGSHTHYLAAESQREAEFWVSVIREAWLHCFSHTARRTGSSGATPASAGVAVSQKLMAENALLRESIQELNQQVMMCNGEYWRKWVEEKAKNSMLESKLANAAAYEVLVKTGGMKGAATDARVYLELYGPDAAMPGPKGPSQQSAAETEAAGAAAAASATTAPAGIGSSIAGLGGAMDSSGEVRLFDADSPVKPFQRGATDTFTVACYNVGLPARLKVWHDNTGCHPDWFLVEVQVRKKGARDWVTFPCNRWLSTEYEDGSISRILMAGSSGPPMSYKVVVVTTDIRGAGTDANVHLQLHGLLRDGLRQQLLGGATAFNRGSHDEFFMEDADLGELTAVTICHDGSGSSPAWHLDYIEVIPQAALGTCAAALACGASPGTQGPASPAGSANGCGFYFGSGGASPDARRVSVSSPGPRVTWSNAQQLLSNSRNSSPTSPWGQVRSGGSAVTYLFPCAAWLDETLGEGVTKRKLPVASHLEPKAWYTLYITTSDVRGAATDADVHVALTGSQGSSGVIVLPSRPQQFQRGQRDMFRLQLSELGQLQKLLIGHNNHGEQTAWHLSLVEVVEEESQRMTYFAAGRWLGAQCGDGLSEITLTASSDDPREELIEYEVTFITSNCRGAGTDSGVGFQLQGSRGSTGPVIVSAGRQAFQRGGRDSFTYKRPRLGQLHQLVVWHDNAGANRPQGDRGAWCLEAVVVSCRCSADEQVVTFPCGSWLSAETQLRVELKPGQLTDLARCQFDVVTSDERGAGTDGAVSLELLSGPPSTAAGPWVLDRPGAFGRGQVDTFTVEEARVHSPTALKITLQSTHQNPNWHLDHIICTVLDGSGEGRKVYFIADRWFESGAGSMSAVLQASNKPPAKPDAGLLAYTVKVFTSPLKGAGTDANVALNVIGARGHSGWHVLPARQEAFEQGQEDDFTLKLPDLGPLSHLGVKSDGTGQKQAWHLAKVCISPPAQTASAAVVSNTVQQHSGTDYGGIDGRPVWFNAQRWLDATHGLEVLLEAQPGDPSQQLVAYNVQVYTSDIKNAGTDCRVFLQLQGETCIGAPVELLDPGSHQAAATFQRGCVDSFDLQLPVLGPLKLAAVWLEGRGCPWHLELIIVTGPQGDQTFFACGAWLAGLGAFLLPGQIDGPLVQAAALCPAELTASSRDPRKLMKDYKIVTYTSNIPGAGTDAAVYVELFDSSGASSGRKQLISSAPDAFERGEVDEFRLRCQALGELVKLKIGHDGTGARPAWHLMKVVVTDVAAHRTWFFAGECWLDTGRGDGALEKALTASSSDTLADRRVYKVTVVTSKRQGSRTDAAVFVTLHGSKGQPVTSANTSSHAAGTPTAASGVLMRSMSTTSITAAGTSSPRDSSSRSNTPTAPAAAASSSWRSSGRCELKAAGSSNRPAFEAGSTNSFLLPPMQDLGQLRQLTLELDAATLRSNCSWHCQHVEVTSSDDTWLFPCNAWLGSPAANPPTAAGGANAACELSRQLLPAPSLDSMLRQQQLELEQQQKERYKVAVYTSDMSSQQSCLAALSLTVYGTAGEAAGPFKLDNASKPCFAGGCCDVFEFSTAPKLGSLQRIKVVCKPTQQSGSWHLDTISITALSTGVITWFFAGRWFDADAVWEAALQGASSDVRAEFQQYRVTTHTSDLDEAGTSARVSIELYGAAGSSGSQELTRPGSSSSSSGGSSSTFGRGQTASFNVRCRQLGELQRLLVWHDSSGPEPAWHLAYIEVLEVSTGKLWYFPCGRWLDSKQGDRATRRSLAATSNFDPDCLLSQYRIAVVTGNLRGASTDAAVSINIFGSQGATGLLGLNPAGPGKVPGFDRGSRQEVKVSGADVGEMTRVLIGRGSSGGPSPGWFLESLEVEHVSSGQVLCFTVNRWLDDKREGCSLQYELLPDANQQQQLQQETEAHSRQTSWELVVVTGAVLNAGTDADVSVELLGTAGSFGPHPLPAGPEAFQTGCKDTFRLQTTDIGELLTFIIGHNNKGQTTTWFLQSIELTHISSGMRYIWDVAAWLDIQNSCSKMLKAQDVQRGPQQEEPAVRRRVGSSCSYQLEIQTSDLEGAGTSASMFVQLVGEACETEAVQLQSAADSPNVSTDNPRAMFQRASLDIFLLRGLPDVGTFKHITIGHDNSGPHPGWHVAWVRVINLTTGFRALFKANMWLDASRPGCKSWVQLSPGPDDPSFTCPTPVRQQQQQQQPSLLPGQLHGPAVFGPEQQGAAAGRKLRSLFNSRLGQPGYSITFVTSNIWGGGTGSKVFFELIGEHGSSGVVYASSQRGQFSRGHRVCLLYPRLPYLGQLHQLRVGTDGSGMFAAWHLRQVEVMHVHSGSKWLFDCHDWIDRRSNWQKLLPAATL